ncbi:MAG: pantetheine-phosphate adenylyltransferase [Actinomycetia bacterium]|nr:pantetheine-phosphate adenylyltransferase [Actinomycetes bacterium]MCP4226068.1 pantetheine-phosphate adenylyltransferase [Actinomycetes bacterium]MCP5031975.1 pantetheine-phosphate adenylyltransferase [Actinomycetes bacterium]
MAVALYPGSFDPVHNGHVAVIAMAASIFDEVIVGVGHNPAKPSGFFTPDERIDLITESVSDLTNVMVVPFTGLVTAAAAELGVTCLIKGLRSASDLDVEMLQAKMNSATGDDLPTVFLPGIGTNALVSSRYVREIASVGGDVSSVVPIAVQRALAVKRDG